MCERLAERAVDDDVFQRAVLYGSPFSSEKSILADNGLTPGRADAAVRHQLYLPGRVLDNTLIHNPPLLACTKQKDFR